MATATLNVTPFRWQLLVPQFSLRTLLAWAVLASFAALALASASPVWAQVALTAVLLAGATTLLIAIYSRGEERARALGRIIFGGTFFLWTVAHVDRLVNTNAYNTPQFCAITETVNQLAYEGICRLRGMGRSGVAAQVYGPGGPLSYDPNSPPGYYPTVSYRLLSASPDAGSEPIIPPAIDPDELVEGEVMPPVYTPPQLAIPAGAYPSTGWVPAPTMPNPMPIQPAVSLLPYYEFHTIANCFWTLVCGALGGWIATVVYRRRCPETLPA